LTKTFIHYNLIRSFDRSCFESQIPYPWQPFEQFLTPKGFRELHLSYPGMDKFEKQVGYYRGKEKPHDRYLLSYEDSIYHEKGYEGRGVVLHRQLPEPWQAFIKELERPNGYKSFIGSILRSSKFKFRYEWHLGYKKSEVSPHVDINWKLGNHLFYFNTEKDWNSKWGGSTLILGEKRNKIDGQTNFKDFKVTVPVANLENHSVLMRNTPEAWHGVKPLSCPVGVYRKIFMIIFVPADFSADRWLTNSLSALLKHKPRRSRAAVLR